MREAPSTDLERAIATINTWDTFDDDPEGLGTPDLLRRFLTWGGRPELAGAVDDDALGSFRDARDRVRGAVVAPTLGETVDGLNAVLAPWDLRLRFEAGDGQWQPMVTTGTTDPTRAWFAPIVVALLEAVRDGRWSRFGTCAADPCTCVYLDTTRNRSRRYCSDLCNDRMAQAALRRRRADS